MFPLVFECLTQWVEKSLCGKKCVLRKLLAASAANAYSNCRLSRTDFGFGLFWFVNFYIYMKGVFFKYI